MSTLRVQFPSLEGHTLAGRLDLPALMDTTYTLDRVQDALSDLEAGRITRGVIRFDA